MNRLARVLVMSLWPLGAGAAFACDPATSAAPLIEVWLDLSQPVAATARDPEAARAQGRRVQAQQAEVLAALQPLHAIVSARLRHARNAIAVRIAPECVPQLAAIPGVVRVRPVQTLYPPSTQHGGTPAP